MRRKIEKYLAQKTGMDESQIEPSEDGRYDFKSDFEGVLAAVRGSDGHSGPLRGSSRGLSSGGTRSHTTSDAKSSAHGSSTHRSLSLSSSYYHHPYPPYNSYSSLYHAPSSLAMGKENSGSNLYPGYWPSHSNQGENYLLSAKKSIFDSPPKQSIKPRSIMEGMTPPLSDLKNTFATPNVTNNESDLSQEEATSLNKSLFSEAVMSTPFGHKTPKLLLAKAEAIQISIGCDDIKDYRDNNMELSDRVSISPIYRDAGKASFFEDDEELSKSVLAVMRKDLDKDIMPPPTAPRVRNVPITSSKLEDCFVATTPYNVTQDNDSSLTPFDSCKMMAKHLNTTPSTAATARLDESSYWNEEYNGMSPVPLSPFHSPGPFSTQKKKTFESPSSSGKKRRREEEQQ